MLNIIHRYKVNKALKSVGINPKHKTANQVFDELSAIWNDMSEDTQKNISIALAGERDANVFEASIIKDGFRFGE